MEQLYSDLERHDGIEGDMKDELKMLYPDFPALDSDSPPPMPQAMVVGIRSGTMRIKSEVHQ